MDEEAEEAKKKNKRRLHIGKSFSNAFFASLHDFTRIYGKNID